MMSNYEIAAKLVKEYFSYADCGLFNCRNIVGDPMVVLYDNGKFSVEICYHYSYFEVFGLSEEEFQKLSHLYLDLIEEANKAAKTFLEKIAESAKEAEKHE